MTHVCRCLYLPLFGRRVGGGGGGRRFPFPPRLLPLSSTPRPPQPSKRNDELRSAERSTTLPQSTAFSLRRPVFSSSRGRATGGGRQHHHDITLIRPTCDCVVFFRCRFGEERREKVLLSRGCSCSSREKRWSWFSIINFIRLPVSKAASFFDHMFPSDIAFQKEFVSVDV